MNAISRGCPSDSPQPVLSLAQVEALRAALAGRLLAVCFGSGVDSTAMLVALHAAGLRPDIITFADTGAEKPETLAHIEAMDTVLRAWGWPCSCRTDPGIRWLTSASSGTR